jgi:uncharacterized membrane protein
MSSAETSTRRIHLWSGLIVLCVFLAGAVAGAGLSAWLHPPPSRPPPPRHGWLPPHLGELELTVDQQKKAQVIFEKYRTIMEDLVQETFPRVRATQDQMEQELRAILTDAQGKKLDEIRARRPPPPSGGPRNHGPPGLGPEPDGPPPPPFDRPPSRDPGP